jgi:hypothetical protein
LLLPLITNICKKAVQQLNILKRIGKNLNRLTIFHTFILSSFNFCPLSWHFCSEKITKKIEKVQKRALFFVYFDYTSSYNKLLVKVKLSSLHVRRTRLMAIETFKIINCIAPPVLDNKLQKRDSRYNFRYPNILQVPQVRTTSYGKKSFSYAAPVLWNSLPEHFRTCNNFIYQISNYRVPAKCETKRNQTKRNETDYFIKVWFQLSNWFQTRRFLCEFPIGSYVKLSSAVGAILVEGPNRLTYFWKRTTQ